MNDRKYRAEHGRKAMVGLLRTKATNYFDGKHLPRHSVERKGHGVGVQTRALSAAWSFGLHRWQRFARMTTSEAANAKFPILACSMHCALRDVGICAGVRTMELGEMAHAEMACRPGSREVHDARSL